jgi:hypothetical protein
MLVNKGIGNNIKYVQGDILQTVTDFVKYNPNVRICLLHIDVDIYEPTKCVLEYLYPLLVSGGIVVFDDYGIFTGATSAIEEYFGQKLINKYKGLHTPSYIVK